MMDKATAEALEASIAHHEKNMAAEYPAQVELGQSSCALCGIFWENENCGSCPVKLRTGSNHCEGTPYSQLEDRSGDWMEMGCEESHDAFLAAEQEEIDFLKSLREKTP